MSDVGRTDVSPDDGAHEGNREAREDGRETGGAAERSAADDPIERAVAALRAGEPICVHDFDDRECETDLIYPAAAVDADAVARLRTDAGGLVCVALSAAVADAADLPYLADAVDHPAVGDDELAYGDRASFSFTVNHRDVYTGITDEDRALTISELAAFAGEVDGKENGGKSDRIDDANGDDATAAPGDATAAFAERFRVPGHVHLLRAAPGLLAERQGHTELGIALAREAGIEPAVVVCEMLDGDSGGARSTADAREYARSRGIPFLRGEQVVDRLE